MIKQKSFFNEKKIIDRREKPRFKVKANCSFQPIDHSKYYDDFDICKIEDISLDGMSLLSEKGYNLDKRLFFLIAIQGSKAEEPINAVGDVIWVSQYNAALPYKYKIGVRFIKILEDDLINLSHHFNEDTLGLSGVNMQLNNLATQNPSAL